MEGDENESSAIVVLVHPYGQARDIFDIPRLQAKPKPRDGIIGYLLSLYMVMLCRPSFNFSHWKINELSSLDSPYMFVPSYICLIIKSYSLLVGRATQ